MERIRDKKARRSALDLAADRLNQLLLKPNGSNPAKNAQTCDNLEAYCRSYRDKSLAARFAQLAKQFRLFIKP